MGNFPSRKKSRRGKGCNSYLVQQSIQKTEVSTFSHAGPMGWCGAATSGGRPGPEGCTTHCHCHAPAATMSLCHGHTPLLPWAWQEWGILTHFSIQASQRHYHSSTHPSQAKSLKDMWNSLIRGVAWLWVWPGFFSRAEQRWLEGHSWPKGLSLPPILAVFSQFWFCCLFLTPASWAPAMFALQFYNSQPKEVGTESITPRVLGFFSTKPLFPLRFCSLPSLQWLFSMADSQSRMTPMNGYLLPAMQGNVLCEQCMGYIQFTRPPGWARPF